MFRSDRRFEFEKFKRFELSGWKRAILPFYLMAVIVTVMFERNWRYPYSIYWIFYTLFYAVIFPLVMLYQATKPKTYEILSTGIRIDGHLIRWKNFRRIRVEGDYVILERFTGTPIALPKVFKEVVERWSGRDSLITPQQGGPSSSQP